MYHSKYPNLFRQAKRMEDGFLTAERAFIKRKFAQIAQVSQASLTFLSAVKIFEEVESSAQQEMFEYYDLNFNIEFDDKDWCYKGKNVKKVIWTSLSQDATSTCFKFKKLCKLMNLFCDEDGCDPTRTFK